MRITTSWKSHHDGQGTDTGRTGRFVDPEDLCALDRHDDGCVAEAIQDAYDLGHDEPDGIRGVAAQLLGDGDSPCRCGGEATGPAAG